MCPEIFGMDSYSLMCGVGLGSALAFVIARKDRFGDSIKNIIWFVVSAIVGLIIGSKVVFFISRLPYLSEAGASGERYIEELVEAGYVFYGGVIGAYAGLIVRARMIKAPLRNVLNFFTPAFAFFHAFGRIGCFCAGCCYGIEVEKFGFVMADGIRKFPVQLVESVFEFLMVALLLMLEKRAEQKKKSPKLSFYYLMTYSTVRFCLELLRGDEDRGFFGPLSTSQWIALIIITTGIIWRIRLLYQEKR